MSNNTPQKTYSVQFNDKAWEQLMALSDKLQNQITDAIETLEISPRPAKRSKKLKGIPYYRLRSGDHCIVYDIRDEILLVLILEIDNR